MSILSSCLETLLLTLFKNTQIFNWIVREIEFLICTLLTFVSDDYIAKYVDTFDQLIRNNVNAMPYTFRWILLQLQK
jgi:hypothetical protein